MIQITLCMGSSCYSRGNAKSLQILEDYLKEKKWEATILLAGNHCLENCSQGPNITINGTPYSRMHPEGIIDTLLFHMEGDRP